MSTGEPTDPFVRIHIETRQAVERLAYELWAKGFSSDADTNWFEAERRLGLGFELFFSDSPIGPE